MTLSRLLAHDRILSQRVARGVKTHPVRAVVWVLARSGDSWLWLLITILLMWRSEPLGWSLLVAIVTTAIIVYISKSIFKRQRPAESRLSIGSDKYAFPSGHAARSGVVAIALITYLPQFTPVWALWAILVCIARVALSRHFVSDVLGGLLLGIWVGTSLQFVLK